MQNHQRWLWPLYPLKAGSAGNWSGEAGVAAGEVVDLTSINGGPLQPIPGGRIRHGKRSLREMRDDARASRTTERYYAPTTSELSVLGTLFPHDAPTNPSWIQIEARLVVAGFSLRELRRATAATVVQLLAQRVSTK